jgi:hypothetical protein
MIPAKVSATAFEATAYTGGLRRLCWLCMALFSSAFALAEPLELRGEEGRGHRPEFQYLVDETGERTLAEIRQLPDAAFRRSGANGVTLAFIPGAVWVRFEVLNRSPPDTNWLLQIADPLLDDIRVYQELDDGTFRESRLGDRVQPTADVVDSIMPVLLLTPPLDQPTTLYLRVQSKSSMLVDLRLMTARQFYQASMASFLSYGAMFGIMVAMCLYNLVLFLSLRDTNYLLYVLSITSTGLFLASLSGHAPRWLWPEHRAWSEEIFQAIVAVTLPPGELM